MTDWTTVAVAGVSGLTGIVAALGAIAMRERYARRANLRQVRLAAYTRFIAASESLSLRAIAFREDKSPQSAIRDTLQSQRVFVVMLGLLVWPYVRRYLSSREIIALGRTLPMPIVEPATVSPSDLMDSLDELQQARVELRFVAGPEAMAAAAAVFDAAAEFVGAATVRIPSWRQRAGWDSLMAKQDSVQQAHDRFMKVANDEALIERRRPRKGATERLESDPATQPCDTGTELGQ